MPVVQCQNCGAEFWREPNEGWKKLCYSCWQEKQEQSQVSALRRHLRHLQDSMEEMENRLASQDNLIDYQERVIAHLQARLAEADCWLALLQQHSRFLLLACHPDRNPAHSESATAVTQALLALRQQVAGRQAPGQQVR